MRHFPIFLDLDGRRVAVSGAGSVAEPKLRLLLKTKAAIEVYGESPNDCIRVWAKEGRIALFERQIRGSDLDGAALLYCANGDPEADRHPAKAGKARGVLVNVVDNLEASQFITPAIVDRDPVTVAIGTEGTAPVLARCIKSDLEARLPSMTGALASIARTFRGRAAIIRTARQRRDFWSKFFGEDGPAAWREGGRTAVEDRLKGLLVETLSGRAPKGSIQFVNVGSGDPDFLSVRAKRVIEAADRIIHEPKIPRRFWNSPAGKQRFPKLGLRTSRNPDLPVMRKTANSLFA